MIRMGSHPPVISRTKGACSTCNRGHGFKGVASVVLIKLAPPPLTAEERAAAEAEGARILDNVWCGLCLKCAALALRKLRGGAPKR